MHTPFCRNIGYITNRKSLVRLHIVPPMISGTKYAGLPDHPKRDMISPCSKYGVKSVWTDLASNTGEWHPTTGTRWVSLFFILWFVSYLRCSSSTMITRVCVSESKSATNCFDFSKKSMPLVLARCFIKSFAPMRIQSFLMRLAKS